MNYIKRQSWFFFSSAPSPPVLPLKATESFDSIHCFNGWATVDLQGNDFLGGEPIILAQACTSHFYFRVRFFISYCLMSGLVYFIYIALSYPSLVGYMESRQRTMTNTLSNKVTI